MVQHFVCSPSFPSFRMFRDDYCMDAMKTLAGANKFSTLSILDLKIHANAENNALMIAIKKWH